MIKPVSINEIKSLRKAQGKVTADIMEFANSDAEAAEVVTTGYKDAASCNSVYSAATRKAKSAVKVIKRGDRVFMVKESALSDQRRDENC